MNPTKFFWNTLACCLAVLTLSLCIIIWRSQEVNIKEAGFEVNLMVSHAQHLVDTSSVVASPTPSSLPTTQSTRQQEWENIRKSLDNLKTIQQSITK